MSQPNASGKIFFEQTLVIPDLIEHIGNNSYRLILIPFSLSLEKKVEWGSALPAARESIEVEIFAKLEKAIKNWAQNTLSVDSSDCFCSKLDFKTETAFVRINSTSIEKVLKYVHDKDEEIELQRLETERLAEEAEKERLEAEEEARQEALNEELEQQEAERIKQYEEEVMTRMAKFTKEEEAKRSKLWWKLRKTLNVKLL
jgi:hypothetical protein